MVIENYIELEMQYEILLQYGEIISLGLLSAGLFSLIKKNPINSEDPTQIYACL